MKIDKKVIASKTIIIFFFLILYDDEYGMVPCELFPSKKFNSIQYVL
jgi:hypothetical protein